MEILRRKAYARAGLVGNPSDGYHGKTISVIIKNFWAEVVLYEWEDVELVMTDLDQSRFSSVQGLIQDVKLHGYYGGMRLLKATVKKVAEFLLAHGFKLHDRNFSLRYQSNIPRQVGLAGSSAIITAALRCLLDFYKIELPKEVQPSLVLAVEKEELGIAAGLQDRVIQAYEGVVYMDFSQPKKTLDLEHGVYEPLDPKFLPPLYIAYSDDASEPTETFHNKIRERFEAKEAKVVEAMKTFASLAARAKGAILSRDYDLLAKLMNENFDTRRSIFKLAQAHIDIVETARKTGASAKFAGSGGAIVGAYTDDAMFERLQKELGAIGCKVIKQVIL